MENRFEVRGSTTAILLDTKHAGKLETTIDTEDLPKAMKAVRWFIVYPHTRGGKGSSYIQGILQDGDGNKRMVLLHRLITGYPQGVQTDHINRNGLDNRKINLRPVTPGQNSQNRGKSSNNKAGYRNVCWVQECGKWLAQIMVNGKRVYGGMYASKAAAIRSAESLRKKHMPYSIPT